MLLGDLPVGQMRTIVPSLLWEPHGEEPAKRASRTIEARGPSFETRAKARSSG